MYYNNILETIGNTPLVNLPLKLNKNWKLLLKIEKTNPWQSMKDRMAYNMVLDAERKWLIKSGGTIIESSSGNTGIGLSIVAAQRGYKFIAVVDHHASKDKIKIMRAYGAEIHFVESNKWEDEVAVEEREKLAKYLNELIPNSYWTQQADNPANAEAYYLTLWNEIINQTDWNFHAFIGSTGTWWSLSWTARRLKEYNSSIKIFGVEPEWSVIFWPPAHPYLQSGTWNPGNVLIWKNVDYSLIDKWFKVWDKEAFAMARILAKNNWMLIWWSAWWVLYQAIRIIQDIEWSWTLVALLWDWWEKYLDSIYDDKWMENHDLYDQNLEEFLSSLLLR